METAVIGKEQVVLRQDDRSAYDGKAIIHYWLPLYPKAANYVAVKLYVPMSKRHVWVLGYSNDWNGTGPFLHDVLRLTPRMTRNQFKRLYDEFARLIEAGEDEEAINLFNRVYFDWKVEQ